MTLQELSPQYERQAQALQRRMARLRQQAKREPEREERERLARRILALRPLLTEARELAQLTAHYYDRGYTIHEKYRV